MSQTASSPSRGASSTLRPHELAHRELILRLALEVSRSLGLPLPGVPAGFRTCASYSELERVAAHAAFNQRRWDEQRSRLVKHSNLMSSGWRIGSIQIT